MYIINNLLKNNMLGKGLLKFIFLLGIMISITNNLHAQTQTISIVASEDATVGSPDPDINFKTDSNFNDTDTIILTRNLPYIDRVNIYRTDTNEEVTFGSVPLGTQLGFDVRVLNPNTEGSFDRIIEAQLVLDRSKSGSYDYSHSIDDVYINKNSAEIISFTYTPEADGDYYQAVGISTDIDGTYVLSDGSPSGNQPVITIGVQNNERDTITEVVDVTNPVTGRTWMDRNLGASRAATSSTDSQSYGDLYQWGRAADGHQRRNSGTTSTLSGSNQPGHGSFILAPNSPYDWRSPQNSNLWQGLNGTNNPCPSGYRLPTEAEWNAERQSWSSNNAAGAFNSPLKLPVAGRRGLSSGSLANVGSYGDYWSGTVDGANSRNLHFRSSNANLGSDFRAHGLSVRCIKNLTPETEVVDVTNPVTGRTWMDRNLGASRAANSSADTQAYGDLYQWGRAADGHQIRNSGTTSTLSGSNQPGHGSFILAPNSPYDWRSPQNSNLWQGVNGTNNPCPSGYRLPTEAEWNAERQSWSSNNAAGAFNSPLKLPVAGVRLNGSGSLSTVGSGGVYWSGTVDGTYSRYLFFSSSSANLASHGRAFGLSVRCIKNLTPETEVVDVTNPVTGRTWMDRNLGASRAATSSTDTQAYGDLYQWGRGTEGHEKRNSPTTSTLSSSDQPGHGSFILAPNNPFDWRSPQNSNLWQGVNGTNNPCPSGYRLPTEAEWEAERQSWSSSNAAGAFNSPLKLPLAGHRDVSSGSLGSVGSDGYYWSGTVGGTGSRYLYLNSGDASLSSTLRAYGFSGRCIKNQVEQPGLPPDDKALFRFRIESLESTVSVSKIALRTFWAGVEGTTNEISANSENGLFSIYTQDFPFVTGNSIDISEILLKSSSGTTLGRVKLGIRIPRWTTSSTIRDIAGFDAILYLHNMDSGWRNGSRWKFFESEDEYPVSMLIPPNRSFDDVRPNRSPLLFVQGVSGTYPYWDGEFTSSDWSRIYQQYDPWQFYYPYDIEVEKAGKMLGHALSVLSGSESGGWSPGYSVNRIPVVAHSMGGLVARSHVLENPANNQIEKLLMLATPNHGSYTAWRLRNTLSGNTVGSWLSGKDLHAPAYEQMSPGSLYYQSLNTHLPRLGSASSATDYLVMAGTGTRLIPPTHEIKDQDDEVVSLSSASLLKYGVPLVTFNQNHTEIRNPGVENILSFFSSNYQPSEDQFSGNNGFWSQSASGVPPTGFGQGYDMNSGLLTARINSENVTWRLNPENYNNIRLYPSSLRANSIFKFTSDRNNQHDFFFREYKHAKYYLGFLSSETPYQLELGMYRCIVLCRWIPLQTYENLHAFPLNHNHWNISISGDHLLVLGGSGVGSSTQAGKVMALASVTETESSWFVDASVDSVAFTLISLLEEGIEEESFNLTLTTPSGTTITSHTAQSNQDIIFYENISDGFGYYFIRNPEEGIWTLTHNQPAETVELSANAASEIVLVASADRDSYEKGDAARVWIRAESDSDNSPSISVSAFYRGQNAAEFSSIGSLTASFDEEEGRYYADANLVETGEYRFQITMTVQSAGSSVIERTQRVEIEAIELQMLPDVTLLSPEMNATGISTLATFEWAEIAEANYYQIQIIEDGSGFTEEELLIGLFVEETSAEISGFSVNSNYEWRIRAFGDGSASAWSESGHFTTAAGLWIAAYGRDWNLVGLPLETFNSSVSHLFPQNSSGSVFAFDGAYRSQQYLEPGNGYWLNMPESGYREIDGDIIGELNIQLTKGWNLISGTYHPVQLWAIDDPGSVITPGTIYGFDETYFFAGSLQPGRGYWVHAEQSGTISIRTQQGKLQPAMKERQLADIAGHKIVLRAGGATQERFFAVENPESISSANILPPIPPEGMLDARIMGDQWFTQENQVRLRIQHAQEKIEMIIRSPEEDYQLYTYEVELFSADHLIRKISVDDGEVLIVDLEIDEVVIRLLSVSDDTDHRGELPMEFKLYQNYPNPFNPSTLIRFALPLQSEVRLDVFNVIGQRVATLVNSELSAGWHQVAFDASHLSSGMYIYRIQAGSYVETRKLILVK